jgi:KDO2-lipid IV(A) lauroyltransferase
VRLRARLWAFRILGPLLEALPERTCIWLSRRLFGVVARHPAWRRSALRKNLALVLGDGGHGAVDDAVLDRYVARGLDSYARYWAEAFKLPAIDQATVTSRIAFSEGEHHLRDAVASGKGLIIALPHVGSWEWGGTMLAELGWSMTAVAERLEPPALFDWFVRKRERMGLRIVPLDERAGGAIARELRAGGVVGLLCDRDLQGNGIPVTLFGAATTAPAGPATLALRTGAALVCACVYSGPGDDHHVVACPPVDTQRHGHLREDVARVSQAVIDDLGWLIRRAPEQWHVLQPIAPGP